MWKVVAFLTLKDGGAVGGKIYVGVLKSSVGPLVETPNVPVF